MSNHDNNTEENSESELESTSSRRNLLGKGAAAVAVAAVAGAALSKTANADDGHNVVIGSSHGGDTATTIQAASGFSEGEVFLVNDRALDFFATPYDADASGCPGAIGGWSGARNGVYGYTQGGGAVSGVIGVASGGVGVSGSGTTADFRARGSGRVLLETAGVAGPPSGGVRGTIARNTAGDLWYCHTDGLWRKLAGASTAGAFHAITPVRVYDSRAAAPTPGLLAGGTNRLVSVADGRDNAGTVIATNVVLAGATAVTANITVTATTGAFGFLSVNPGGNTSEATSAINWFGVNQNIANGLTLTLNASRQVTVVCGTGGGSTHFIIDISGFYL